ncbi:MAG: ABC transporter ATP-binding protein [Candidatus Pacebacteria bacterium CG10_big_fil_rev_8_21_14_0_10_44_54]|nr:MAG: ABC transporter ATP-binding protein [Candidatus Pacebacteria bacterium CG10_big_fil_rev_8_21_14_0_10_44_54]
MKTSLEINQLRKVYPPEKKGGDEFVAVNDISFKLKQGQILGLLGPNGAGKSTTISMLLGVLTPTSGEIRYFGKQFEDHRSEILNQVGFASTYIAMPWRLTVWENLRVYALLFGLEYGEFVKRAEKFLSKFGVWQQRNKMMNQLSAGQTTRIMLAKAFIPHPKIALLDEPTASLDPDIAHEVRRFVRDQREQHGTSILYTSHNMDEVADLCDDVLFLRKGEIVAQDTPENLARSISKAKVRLQVIDGLKRIERFACEQSLSAETKGREVVLEIDEQKVAKFLMQLADEDIHYSQISIDKPTLEDYFLSMSI